MTKTTRLLAALAIPALALAACEFSGDVLDWVSSSSTYDWGGVAVDDGGDWMLAVEADTYFAIDAGTGTVTGSLAGLGSNVILDVADNPNVTRGFWTLADKTGAGFGYCIDDTRVSSAGSTVSFSGNYVQARDMDFTDSFGTWEVQELCSIDTTSNGDIYATALVEDLLGNTAGAVISVELTTERMRDVWKPAQGTTQRYTLSSESVAQLTDLTCPSISIDQSDDTVYVGDYYGRVTAFYETTSTDLHLDGALSFNSSTGIQELAVHDTMIVVGTRTPFTGVEKMHLYYYGGTWYDSVTVDGIDALAPNRQTAAQTECGGADGDYVWRLNRESDFGVTTHLHGHMVCE